MSQHAYYSFISSSSYIRQFPNYDNSFQRLAYSLVPWEQFLIDFNNLEENLKAEFGDKNDYCLIRLLEFFKSNLFTWVNSIHCNKCDCQCRFIESQAASRNEFFCFNIEIYKCPICLNLYEFPRYNHAGKLLITKKGRCGEWALAFAYLCFVFKYEIRLVCHYDDHVWVEVFSKNKQRWIHCDPCENSYDNPLMYECGWKKRSSLIIAYGMNEVRDVTWRYASNYYHTLCYRQTLFDEKQLIRILDQKNFILQSNLTKNEQNHLIERWLAELTEFLRLPDQILKVDSKAYQSRISGSLEWRMYRGETSNQCIEPKFVFGQNMNCDWKNVKEMKILYDCNHDSYTIYLNGIKQSMMKYWSTGCYASENIFRMVEKDWQMCYLSRTKNCTFGFIEWRVELNGMAKWKIINILLNGQTFESGFVKLKFIYGPNAFSKQFKVNEMLKLNYEEVLGKTEANEYPEYFSIQAKLMFGDGEVAWQHAQLFRQATKNAIDKYTFQIIVYY